LFAAGDERPEQRVADHGLSADDAADIEGGDLEQLGLTAREGADQRSAPRQDVDVARELSGLVPGDCPRRLPGTINHFHRAREHDEEPALPNTGFDERLAVAEAHARSHLREHRDLRLVEPRVCGIDSGPPFVHRGLS